MPDAAVEWATAQVIATAGTTPPVQAFFDRATNSVSYVVYDPSSKDAAIIDSVLDFDLASAHISYRSAEAIIAYVRSRALNVKWHLETHVHADHMSAACYLREMLGGKIAIGRFIVEVQRVFGSVFNEGEEFARDGADFDRLFDDGDIFAIGTTPVTVLHLPGHTPADLAYVVGDAAFVGDTIFMPDYGTARCDFPGGDARLLYRSIKRLLSLPEQTRLFMCHDYASDHRSEFAWETTVEQQRRGNIHVRDDVDEDAFVAMRRARDITLSAPRLLLPAMQVNMRAGRLPAFAANGTRYLKIPLNVL